MPVETNVNRNLAQSFPYLPLAGGTMTGDISFDTGKLVANHGITGNLRSQSTSAIVTQDDFAIYIDAHIGNRTVTFPASLGFINVNPNGTTTGQIFIVIKTDSSSNTVTIQSSAGETFAGNATIVLATQWETTILQATGGTDWIIIRPLSTTGGTIYGTLRMNKNYAIYFDSDGTDNCVIYSDINDLLNFQDKNNNLSLDTINKFIGKSDTPASYSGAGTKMVRVNAGATALEFVTDDHITKADTSYFRPLYGYEGSVLQGTWSWVTNANQTNYSTNRNLAAGVWQNLTSHANNDEMAWHLYLGPGTYEIDVVYIQDTNRGKISLIWGPGPTLATLDAYGATTYNKTFSTDLVITTATYSYLYFLCNGKNALSSGYYIDFSRLEIFKKG